MFYDLVVIARDSPDSPIVESRTCECLSATLFRRLSEPDGRERGRKRRVNWRDEQRRKDRHPSRRQTIRRVNGTLETTQTDFSGRVSLARVSDTSDKLPSVRYREPRGFLPFAGRACRCPSCCRIATLRLLRIQHLRRTVRHGMSEPAAESYVDWPPASQRRLSHIRSADKISGIAEQRRRSPGTIFIPRGRIAG